MTRYASVPRTTATTGALLLMTGPMFAGKSSALIAHASACDGGVLVLKPAFDVRDGVSLVSSRDGSSIAALPVSSWPAQAASARTLVIDEVQFLVAPHYDGDIVDEVLGAVASGQKVVVGGLDTDYLKRPFEPVARLAGHAARHVRLTARCHVCDAPACWTAKRQETGRRLELGCDELYEARCDLHWSPPDAVPAAKAGPQRSARRRLAAGVSR
jgi:thymidine kinase